MYGQVHYFVPEWDSGMLGSTDSGEMEKQLQNLGLDVISKNLPHRYFTVGRKAKVPVTSQNCTIPCREAPLHKVHDLEIENDTTVSFHQCYFTYKPDTKEWYLQDGKLDLNTTGNKKSSSNGTWLYLHKPRRIESG